MTEVRNRILWVALQPVSYFIVCRDNSFYVVLFMVCLFYGVFMWVDDANGICSIVHGMLAMTFPCLPWITGENSNLPCVSHYHDECDPIWLGNGM